MNINQLVKQVNATWKIEKICKELSEAKQVFTNSEREQTLSQKESDCLCALLCNKQPREIAKLLGVNPEGINVDLSRGLYRYIETLIQSKTNEAVRIQWSNIPRLLENLGYKRSPFDPPTNGEVRAKWRLTIDIPHIHNLQLEAILDLLRRIMGNASLRVEKIEEGSIVLVFDGTQEGFEQIQELFRTGELTELLGVPVLDVQLESVIQSATPVNLGEWFQDNFVEAIQAGWQTIEEIFGIRTRSPAFRSNAVKRAKQIQVGDRALALILDLKQIEDGEISTFLGVYPLGEQTYLPENLKIAIFIESEEPLEIPVTKNSQGLIQELFFSSGEQFRVQLSLGDDSITEYFSYE
ncbi:DUF1822 family protein [Microcoleus sp. FACHB-831]|uniref:DUF1822 family protein n=1 Tax=Microcoleus sp. FACHB-831 TaxID=2692827 RepID=UPI00168806A9|nr:DUF1822 family protein [Microcoleus sp. FACHB-831]MBD1921126.1 DUF1822 family protein [Microcoleus sp. FACHB-831]